MKNVITKLISRALALCFALLIYEQADAQQISAQNDLFKILENSCNYYLDVKANDVDTSHIAQPQIITQPLHGTCTLNTNYISYCPNAGFTGADYFQYSISSGIFSSTATAYLNVLPFNSSVFPGDADQNGKIENFDLLAIGLAYNLAGPSRQNAASVNALTWSPSSYLNTNPGAADCTGDGIVDSLDIAPVQNLYGNTIAVESPYDVDTSLCNNGTPFFIEALSGDSVSNGDVLHVAIKLGNDLSINSAYGIAFSLDFDTGFIGGNGIQFSTNTSWILENDRGLFLQHNSQTDGKVDIAISKTNHLAAHGGGTLMEAFIPIDDNIDGIMHAPGWYNLRLNLSKVRLISPYNVVQEICITSPSIQVYAKSLTAIKEANIGEVNIYPNPTANKIFVKAEGIQRIEISDITGRTIYTVAYEAMDNITIDTRALGIEDGAYLVRVKTENSSGIKKIIVQQ